MRTVVFLTELGYDVILIPKSNVSGEHSLDIKMQGLYWEIKCLKEQGKYLIRNTLHRAAHQSENVIIDLSRIKIHQARCLRELKKCFRDLKSLSRLKVITKTKKLVYFV